MKPRAITCSRCAVRSIMARWIRDLCGTNSGYGQRQNDRMLPFSMVSAHDPDLPSLDRGFLCGVLQA